MKGLAQRLYSQKKKTDDNEVVLKCMKTIDSKFGEVAVIGNEMNPIAFKEEINLLKNVFNHENIIKCMNSYDDNIMELEYCQGGDLTTAHLDYVINNRGRGLPSIIVAKIFVNILTGLHEMHSR